MKRAMLNLMVSAGAFAPFRLANRSKIVILTYHRFGDDGGEAKTSPRIFARQLEYLSQRYTVMPLSIIAQRLIEGVELPPYAAAITIDDGYADAYEIAFPLLRGYGVPATVFAVSDFLDRKGWIWTDKLRFLALQSGRRQAAFDINGGRLNLIGADRQTRLASAARINESLKKMPDELKEEAIDFLAAELGVQLPALPPAEFGALTWEQAREMQASQIEIGSHTVTHPILPQLDDERLAEELAGSKSRIEQMLGNKADLFCYPNGNFDQKVLRATELAGYLCAVTTQSGFNDSRNHPLTLCRIDAERDLVHFVQSISGFEEVKNKVRRFASAKQVGGIENVQHKSWD